MQPNSDESDRHHHRRPYYPDYYPYPYPPTPQRPPFQVPGLNDYFGGGGPSIIIINPNNAQNLTAPAAPAAATTGGRSGGLRRNAVPIIDLLQGLNAQEDDTEVINAADNESEAAAAAALAAAQAPLAQYGAEERDEDLAEDELALLERQAARGLSTKQLLSLLLQDKRRRHFQEAAAGIYLRNYNQNRKWAQWAASDFCIPQLRIEGK